MTLEDLREQIQHDIIACADGYADIAPYRWELDSLTNHLCQIVVDRFKEYDVSSSDITT